jgi:hypothetical protein
MVLVGSLSLVDGMSAGVGSVATRFQIGPVVYLHGSDLLASAIDPSTLTAIPGNYSILRVHMGTLSVGGASQAVVVASLSIHADGTTTVPFPANATQVALDSGLVQSLSKDGGSAPANVNLTVLGVTLTDVPVAPPPATRPVLFPNTWAWVDDALLAAINPSSGTTVQAVLTAAPLAPALSAKLGLTSLNTLGAVAFVQGSVAEARSALDVLSLVIGVVIVLLVLSAMGLEVQQREAELRTLRGLGASPRAVALLVGGRALFLGVLGATLGSALGIAVAHAVVSFAPLFGYPSLIVLAPPYAAVLLVYGTTVGASVLGALVPAFRAVSLARATKGAIPS